MRNAKKLLLLLLSIALLCGIFIVTALAEDGDASAEPEKDYVSIVSSGLDQITTLKEGETIFNSKVITKTDGTTTELFYIGSEKILYEGTAPRIVTVTASNGIGRDIQPGETVTSDMLGQRIALLSPLNGETGLNAKRMKAILWESDGVHYNYLVWEDSTKNTPKVQPGELIRQIFANTTWMGNGKKMTLYNNVSYDSTAGNAFKGVDQTNSYFDLNGHTLELAFESEKDLPALDVTAGTLYLYSSKAGGKVVYGVDGKALVKTSGSGTVYFGEKESPSTEYGKNLTVEVSRFNSACDGGGIKILGGTYIQPAEANSTTFLTQGGANFDITNATFILKGTLSALWQPGVKENVLKNSGGKGDAGHVTVISENEIKLFNDAFPESTIALIKGVTFNYWYFYNVKPSLPSVQYYYPYSFFDKSYTDVFGNTNPLRIACAGDKKTKTVDGKEYTFRAQQELEGKTALVQWGFDIPAEYWVVGAQASNDDAVVVVDDLFAYGFAPFEVQEGENCPTPTILKAVKPGTISMSLTLQSQISMNLSFSEALNGATITVGGTPLEEGKRTCTYAVAPDKANIGVTVTIGIGENTHTVQVNVGSYASALLASTKEEHASARNLTYAMVEYVRVMANDPDFLKDVSVPTGYETLTPGENKAANEGALLESIAFKLDSTIALAILGTNDAVGKEVTLKLADRTLTATIGENKQAIFEGLYVNEFYGPLTLTVEGETYTYSIENYYNAIANKDAVAALYNYVEYANAYVNYLKENS